MALASEIEVSCTCSHCQCFQEAPLSPSNTGARCKGCQNPLFPHPTEKYLEEGILNRCPACACSHLFRQRDFNRRLGVCLVVLGVGLAYFTYGLSLLGVTLLDWAISRKVGQVGICYQCEAHFRNKAVVKTWPEFNLSLHDFYKNLKNNPRLDPSDLPVIS